MRDRAVAHRAPAFGRYLPHQEHADADQDHAWPVRRRRTAATDASPPRGASSSANTPQETPDGPTVNRRTALSPGLLGPRGWCRRS